MRDEDARVIDKARWSSSGISAIDVATASLGDRARRHTKTSLSMIGLSIVARLCGEGHLEPTRSNLFRLKRKDAA